jgi:hypothetical protein
LSGVSRFFVVPIFSLFPDFEMKKDSFVLDLSDNPILETLDKKRPQTARPRFSAPAIVGALENESASKSKLLLKHGSR